MAGRVDQVEDIVLAVVRLVVQAHGLGLDGDAALALDIHIVEHLLGHLALGKAARRLDQTIGQRRFAVVDMGHDREIADMGKRSGGIGAHARHIAAPPLAAKR